MPEQHKPTKQEHCLFSVRGQKLEGLATALIIATTEADAEGYALSELDFVTVSETYLVSDSVYTATADTKEGDNSHSLYRLLHDHATQG